MKLIFEKNEKGDIEVQIQKGTNLISFNYVEMLKQLLDDNTIAEDCEFENLDEEEISVLKNMLNDITKVISDGQGTQSE
ncbi:MULTISPECIES: hypothetical protein [Bacteroides]|uniref:hypothetical protein n=1 Tax=Bacteroides TaxID=816 RepID=UPI0001BC78C7|nr:MULTISPECIES: hypothetical protein [Bacteroides]EFS30335.1 hypothetical protein BSGG_1035 [Bacteroides sp. D2]MBG9217000.1 hypothetical protein [Bacteroides ovatus]MBG9231728.1 hypothetical protein [Bacteroides ovatus]UWN97343.1 hypothetical protein NQ505_12885 [Bacteroides sp. D2]